jgi:hypothetical protein
VRLSYNVLKDDLTIGEGMSFRMALDLGLHLSCDELVSSGRMSQEEANARAITFWGCYLYDK